MRSSCFDHRLADVGRGVRFCSMGIVLAISGRLNPGPIRDPLIVARTFVEPFGALKRHWSNLLSIAVNAVRLPYVLLGQRTFSP